ncbi:unnamed protein product [Candida verbasci]|uniref:Proline dehydrogenase n=1 Tax=Candida verbasci TaxID=1227364 RepID=A0A9W4U0D4_9ASCO|nr:unnamed protein product [Candida verbasci]
MSLIRFNNLYKTNLSKQLLTRSILTRSILAAKCYQYRDFHDSIKSNNTTTSPSSNQSIIPQLNQPTSPSSVIETPLTQQPKPSSIEYLSDFNNLEIISFFMIGLCTLNKPILNLCIKLFPYVPISIIKKLVYRIYCGGETIGEVKQTGLRLHDRGINNMMISLTIEDCEGNGESQIDTDYIVSETSKSIEKILVPHTLEMINQAADINDIPPGYVALKSTGFDKNAAATLKDFNTSKKAEFDSLVEKISSVCQTIYDSNEKLFKKYNDRTSPFVVGVIDAEKFELQEGVYELQRRLYEKFNPLNKPISIVGTLQMYLSNSASLLTFEEKFANEKGYRLGLKLVRGAYLHSEKNRDEVIHKTKTDTDVNYNKGISYCIDSILNQKGNESIIGHLVVASHNSESLKLASNKIFNESTIGNNNKLNVVLGQLLGMADSVTYDLIKNLKINNVIKYVAWGPPFETKQYLLRRLEENGDAVKNDNGWPLVKASTAILFKRLLGRA